MRGEGEGEEGAPSLPSLYSGRRETFTTLPDTAPA